jgi:hypothetical protein
MTNFHFSKYQVSCLHFLSRRLIGWSDLKKNIEFSPLRIFGFSRMADCSARTAQRLPPRTSKFPSISVSRKKIKNPKNFLQIHSDNPHQGENVEHTCDVSYGQKSASPCRTRGAHDSLRHWKTLIPPTCRRISSTQRIIFSQKKQNPNPLLEDVTTDHNEDLSRYTQTLEVTER